MRRKSIDRQLLKNWRLKAYDTTQEDIQVKTGISKPTIREALNKGKATKETIIKLTSYFNEMEVAK